MTLHAVLGDGSISSRELAHQLDDMADAAAQAEDNFWFLLIGKESPTQFDKDLIAYFSEGNREVFWAVLCEEGVPCDDIYEGASEQHTFEGDLKTSLVEALGELQEDNEGADLLTVLIDPQNDNPGDADTITLLEAVLGAGYKAYGLNDAMEEISLDEAPENVVPIVEPAKPVKATAKKAKAAAPEPVEEEPTEEEPTDDTEDMLYTKVELESFTAAEIKALATGMGITAKGKAQYIEAILAQQAGEPVAEEEDLPEEAVKSHPAASSVAIKQAATSNPAVYSAVYSGTTTTSSPYVVTQTAPAQDFETRKLALELAIDLTLTVESTIAVAQQYLAFLKGE